MKRALGDYLEEQGWPLIVALLVCVLLPILLSNGVALERRLKRAGATQIQTKRYFILVTVLALTSAGMMAGGLFDWKGLLMALFILGAISGFLFFSMEQKSGYRHASYTAIFQDANRNGILKKLERVLDDFGGRDQDAERWGCDWAAFATSPERVEGAYGRSKKQAYLLRAKFDTTTQVGEIAIHLYVDVNAAVTEDSGETAAGIALGRAFLDKVGEGMEMTIDE